MRRWLGGIVLLGLVGTLGYIARRQLSDGVRLGAPPAPLESRWHTEEEWLVGSIVRDLAEMARFGRAGQAAAAEDVEVDVAPAGVGSPRSVSVTLAPGRELARTLQLGTFVWSPAEYAALARDLLQAEGACSVPPSGGEGGPEGLLGTLTDLRPAVIETANQAVSAALARRFCDPAVHEAAALVLSAFALREAAHSYSDTRGALCRMTAHLALAASLRPVGAAASREGRFASTALHLLAGRGADAATALDALEAESGRSPEARAWCRALRLRLAQDPRSPVAPATSLERRELYRARLWTLDTADALRHAEELGLAEGTDRWRLASEAGPSVEVGNAFLHDALDRELAEAQEVGVLPRDAPPADSDLVAALNEPAERCLTPSGPRVIGRGTWAAFLQRHLIHFLWRRDRHLRAMLGLPADADRELRAAGERFGRLTLYPLVEVRCSLDARRRPERFDDLITLAVTRPQLIPAFEWWALEDVSRYEVVRRGMPTLGGWFAPGLPRGTTFDTVARGRAQLLPQGADAMRSFLAISPQDYDVASAFVAAQFRDEAPVAPLEAIFGARAEYDLRALDTMAKLTRRDFDAHGRVLERQCALVPGHCFDSGHHHLEKGEIAAAAGAYERGLELAADRVMAANNSLWLMNHYLDVGETGRARAVAEEAGETGSYGGLLTRSRFLERTGDFAGAERILRSARERYGNRPQNPDEREESKDGEQDEDDLVGFYYRMAFARGQREYEARFRELTEDDFPHGLEKVDRASLTGFPSDGVFVLRAFPQAERAGLRTGDIIVGLDGHRIRTRRQYYLVRSFTDSLDVSLVVFRHPGYLELKARAPGRRLGIEMRSHKPVSAAPTD